MGLDQYAVARSAIKHAEIGNPAVDFIQMEDDSELYYWRKHADLQGWMERRYRDKGGKSEFNCVPLLLTSEDLDQLEADVKTGALPHTTGFFFGESSPEKNQATLEFIEQARAAITEGNVVIYSSWW